MKNPNSHQKQTLRQAFRQLAQSAQTHPTTQIEEQIAEQTAEPDDTTRSHQLFKKALAILKISAADLHNPQGPWQVAFFFPRHGELDFRSLAAPHWWLPKSLPAQNFGLSWFLYGDGESGYARGSHGIYERPLENCFSLEEGLRPHQSLLCFLPGLGASYQGQRLGSGAGYYDRFLQAHGKRVLSVFCVPHPQCVVPQLPAERHDIKPDLILW